ncbi:MAG: YlbF family regulator [Clostridia bacterium]
MTVLEKAKELAREIGNTEEYLRLKDAEEQLAGDATGNALLHDLRNYNHEYLKAEREGLEDEGLNSISDMIKHKEQELMDYDITYEFITAKNEFDQLMQKINQEIVNEIQGCEGDHEGGCASCSGCK